VPAGYYRAEGIIKNVNTIEEYKALDKKAFLDRSGSTVCTRSFSSRLINRSGQLLRILRFIPARPCWRLSQ
jgi:hypothetical protein